MNRQNATGATESKEEQNQKQLGKPANRGESSRIKPSDTKTQQKKADSSSKTNGKQCSMDEEDDDECEDE